jgi:hypothetical protein
MSASDLVVLKGGLSVPAAAYILALELEARGLHLSGEGDDILVRPRDRLTDADRTALRHLKPHLRRIVDYRLPEVI